MEAIGKGAIQGNLTLIGMDYTSSLKKCDKEHFVFKQSKELGYLGHGTLIIYGGIMSD